MASQLLNAAKFALLAFRRNPAATFFTVVFPLMFMVLFGYIFGSEVADSGATVATFIVPGILVMALVSATLVNLCMTTVFAREKGQLKRLRSTPMPPLVWILAQILASFVIVCLMTVLLILLGRLLFGVTFNFGHLGVFIPSVLLGTATFCALGLALTSIIPSVSAAPAITNLIVLPLYFVSDVFLFGDEPPALIRFVGNLFPIKHMVQSIKEAFNPFALGVEVPWVHWAVMAGWGIFGVIVAARFFRWSPS